MKDLTISQKYYLCALNEKGRFPALSMEVPVCILAGGLLDLILSNCVAIGENKKMKILDTLNDENRHLSSLYTFIKESKPMKVEKLTSEYILTLRETKLKQLLSDISTSLVEIGYVTPALGGLLGRSPCFIPSSTAVDGIIQNIRAELLDGGAVSEDIIALTSLMHKSNTLKQYFSSYEKDQLKDRLKEIKDTPFNRLVKEMVQYVETVIIVAVS